MSEVTRPKPWYRSNGKRFGALASGVGLAEIGMVVVGMLAGEGTGEAVGETVESVGRGDVGGILSGLFKFAFGAGLVGVRRRQDRP